MSTTSQRERTPGEGRAEVLRRALIELKAARAEVAETRRLASDPIAVVGMGCRFPGGASGVEAFWDLLASGGSGVTEVPADRWRLTDFFDADPDAPGRMYSRFGGFVDGIREFDPAVFGIPPREAVRVDPQQRMVLEVAWEALEHAGIAPDSLRGSRTGVFVGLSGSDYERLTLSTGDVSTLNGYTATGSALNMAANRLSYVLGLEGPSLVVDTACSSSLVAVHLACQSLRSGECETAIVAGVNTLLSPGTTVALSKGRMLSPEGRCKTFDASADGYVRGEGCGVVVLRRLSVADGEGRRVWAVVRGSAVNQDGKSSGLTVPRAAAQQRVVRRALDSAGVRPADVGYVEAHGTGTALGDPIEVRALAAVLAEGRESSRPVALGSVKTNIGHLEAAAGIAGLIKTVLSLERKTIPPHLNISRPNPAVAWDELPVRVPTELTEWPDECRVAGVSSFGFGGTNAHVVLESVPSRERGAGVEVAGPVLVKVAGRGEAAVRAGAARLASWVRGHPGVAVGEVAWAANVGRAELPDRAVVVAETGEELAEGLDAVAAGRTAPGTTLGRRNAGGAPQVGFIAPGEGAVPAGALAGVYGQVAAVTEVVDEVAAVFGPVTRLPLRALLEDSEEAAEALQHTATAQPALFTVAVALGRWWQSIGVELDVVSGQGVGAYAAAALAHVCSPADGARLVRWRMAGEPLGERLRGMVLSSPGVDLVTDADVAGPDRLDAGTVGYWERQAAELATYADVKNAVSDRGVDMMAELPSGTVSRRDLLEMAAGAWVAGVDVDWTLVNGPRPGAARQLPTYPFQRQTYWPDGTDPRATLARAPGSSQGAGLRPRVLRIATGEVIGETEVSLHLVPFLEEHRVHGRIVVPGVLFLELVLRCAAEAFGAPAQAQDLVVSRSLVLGDDDSATVQVIVDRPSGGRACARVASLDPAGEWRLHFETVVHADGEVAPPAEAVDDATFDAAAENSTEVIDDAEFYRRAWHPMFRLGPSFRLLRGARRGARAAVGTLVPPAPDAAGIVAGVRPELLVLDACIQLVAVAALPPEGLQDRPVHLGIGYERIRVGALGDHAEFECVCVLRKTADDSMIGDLRMFGTDGTLVAEVWGASFRPVSETMLVRLLDDASATRRVEPAMNVAALTAAGAAERERLVREYLFDTLARTLGAGQEEVEGDAPLVDLADSLMIAELRTRLDQDLSVTLPMDDFFDGVSPNGLVARVAGLLPGQAPPEPERAPAAPHPKKRKGNKVRAKTVEEMTALAELEPSTTATGAPEPPGTSPEATLLTGATGFVGGFLLAELLDRRDGDVYCLVRADDTDHAIRRIAANLRQYGIDPEPRLPRILPVVGDLAEPLLGLDERTFTMLHGEVGDIVHCGGMVKWTYPYSGLAAANVDGTREVLRLATAGAPRPVHFISTVGVFSSKEYTAETVTEDVDLADGGSLVVGYAQTKWVAERMVRSAHERGVPSTIHRINTGGHSLTGAFNRLDHLSLILKGCVEAGIAPERLALMPVQPAPIDYVAAAVVELAGRLPQTDGGTFHLVNEQAMTWKELFDAVEGFGYPLARLPLDDWRDRVTGGQAGTMALLGLAPFLRDTMDHARLPFSESALTREALRGSGVSCPPLTPELVHTFLRAFVDVGFIEPPSS